MISELTSKKRYCLTLGVRDTTVGLWRFRNDLLDATDRGNDLSGVNIDAADYENGYAEAGLTALKLPGPAGGTRKATTKLCYVRRDSTLPTLAGTVGHWKFRGDLIDDSGQGNNLAVAAGTPTYSGEGYTEGSSLTELVDTAVVLTDDSYLHQLAAAATDFDLGTDSFSIELIVKTVHIGAVIVEKFADNKGFFFNVAVGGSFGFYLRDDLGNSVQEYVGSINDGLWHYLVATFDRSTGQARVYIDGTEAATSPFSIAALTGSINSPTANLKVGGGVTDFAGSIDEICITKSVLTAAQVAARAHPGDFEMGADGFTIEAILRTSESAGYVVGCYDALGAYGWRVEINLGQLSLGLGDGDEEIFLGGVPNIGADAAWHHCAIVIDRTADLAYFYVDGVATAASPVDISDIAGSIDPPNHPVDLMVGLIATAGVFEGVIDEISVSRETLSAAAVAERAAGYLVPHIPVVAGELKGFLPGMHDGNPDLDEFLLPFEAPFAGIRNRAKELVDLVMADRVPERFLPSLASLLNFELPDPAVLDAAGRRAMFDWIAWLYQRKGTHACILKFLELLQFDGATADSLPDSFPFVSNTHRLFGYSLVSNEVFADDFSGNLSKWDPPLNQTTRWELLPGALRAEAPANNDKNNAVLFDCSSRVFYLEANVKLIDAVAYDFGFYLDYLDENNWLRFSKKTSGATYWVLEYEVNGNYTMDLLSPSIDSFFADISNGDTIKLWVFVNLNTRTFSMGINGLYTHLETTAPFPMLNGGKKGLWVGNEVVVEWQDIAVLDIRRELAPVLFEPGRVDRRLVITDAGVPGNTATKRAYLARVLPRYLPYGVTIAWAPTFAAVTARAVADGVVVKQGHIFAGPRGASAGAVADGAIAVKGSVTLTPAAARAKAVAEFRGKRINAGVASAGAQTNTPTIKIGNIFSGNRGASARAVATGASFYRRYGDTTQHGEHIGRAYFLDDHGQPQSAILDRDDRVADGDTDSQAHDTSTGDHRISLAIYFAYHARQVDVIKLSDWNRPSEPDGLKYVPPPPIGGQNIQVWKADNGTEWTFCQEFKLNNGDFARLHESITLTLAATHTARYFQIYLPQGLQTPDGYYLEFAEMELFVNL